MDLEIVYVSGGCIPSGRPGGLVVGEKDQKALIRLIGIFSQRGGLRGSYRNGFYGVGLPLTLQATLSVWRLHSKRQAWPWRPSWWVTKNQKALIRLILLTSSLLPSHFSLLTSHRNERPRLGVGLPLTLQATLSVWRLNSKRQDWRPRGG